MHRRMNVTDTLDILTLMKIIYLKLSFFFHVNFSLHFTFRFVIIVKTASCVVLNNNILRCVIYDKCSCACITDDVVVFVVKRRKHNNNNKQNDNVFTIKNVVKHTNVDLPIFYKPFFLLQKK